MGRLNPLLIIALGRSPYEEEPVEPLIKPEPSGILRTGQQYDQSGYPVNEITKRRMRDHIRASNEVLQAAGIIEATAEVQERDDAFELSLVDETTLGLRRLEISRVTLIGGVWGVIGLRRRIMLYKSYSRHGILDIVRGERAVYSVTQMIGAGLPAISLLQGLDWTSLIVQALINGPYRSSPEALGSSERIRIWMLQKTIDISFTYVMLHYQMFSILQQLNLLPAERLFPNLKSFIPFSSTSPFQMPPTTGGTVSYLTSVAVAIGPMLLLFGYNELQAVISSMFYGPVYMLLPRPTNRAKIEEPQAAVAELVPEMSSNSTAQQTLGNDEIEGRNTTDDDSDDDGQLTQTPLISFDLESEEIPDPSRGTWSAELSNGVTKEKPKVYHITALTMLPLLLAAEALSATLATISLLPVEMVILQVIGRTFLGSNSAVVGRFLGWKGVVNLVIVQATEVLSTGVLYTVLTLGTRWFDKQRKLYGRKE